MKEYFLNITDEYHRHDLDSLSSEITLSIMLEDPKSHCRRVLKKDDTFGGLLYDFLATIVPMDHISRIIEIGGGYGFMMRDFLRRNAKLCPTMVDLSPFLLEKQRDTLRQFEVQFIQGDFLEMNGSVLQKMDLAILNEIIGDLPTACQVPRNVLLEGSSPRDPLLLEVQRICSHYGIEPLLADRFTLNVGAIQALERLCDAQIPYIYISEHSCEAQVSQQIDGLLELSATGEPECIRLRGHNEYTIRFSDLEKVAASYGYACVRGQYLDFIEPVMEGEVDFILRVGASRIDRYEIIQQFIEDLVKYEYLVLSLN